MTPARRSARRLPWTGLAVGAGLVWALAAVAVASPGAGPAELTTAVAAGSAALFGLAALRARRRDEERRSADLTAVSERLLRLEGRDPAETVVALRSATGSLASDLELVGRLVTTLGETLRDHDDRLRRMEGEASSPPAPPVAPAAAGAPPSRLETRADFAKAASLILERLAPPSASTPAPAPAASPPLATRDSPATPLLSGMADGLALDALAAGRIELHMQPVVTLPQRKTRLYDAVGRLKGPDGALLPSLEAVEALDRHGRLAALDAEALGKAGGVVRYLLSRGSEAAVSIPVSPRSLRDRDFLGIAERLLGGGRETAGRIVLAIRQHDLRHLGPDETSAVTRLTGLGARLKLDGIGDLGADWAALVRRGFDYVSIDCGVILEPRRPGETGPLIDAARTAGVQLIAAAVDREALVPDLLDFDVPLAQGPALGPARPVRAELLAGADASTPEAASGRPAASGWASFRDHLRRTA